MANDYLTSSNFADVAGSILSKRQSDYKSQAKKALGFSLINNFLGQANQGLIQEKEDAINELTDKYNDIFKLNEEEFTSTYWQNNRNRLKEFIENENEFLNKEALEYLSTTDAAVTAMFGGKEINPATLYQEPDPEVRKTMLDAFNAKRQEIANEMENLKNDPRATMQTSVEYNKLAKAEYLAALEAVKDDPRRKSLMRKAWNRIFRTEKDEEGTRVSTNPAVIELEDTLRIAKENRNTFRDSLDNNINATYAVTPIKFKDLIKFKDSDKADIILTLSESVNKNDDLKDTYQGVDIGYYSELIDDVLSNEPLLNKQEVQSKAFMKLVEKEKSTDEYLNRYALKRKNGLGLIEEFEKLTNNKDIREFLSRNNGFNMYRLMDAYDADNQAKVSAGLAITYEDIIKPIKEFKTTLQEETAVVQKMNLRLDKKKYKDLLNDSNAKGVLARSVLINMNHYKLNNPNWEQEMNPMQLEDAAILYVMDEYDNKNISAMGLSNADILAQQTFSLAELENLPEYIEELQDNKRTDILEFRDYLFQEIEKQELSPDEITDFKIQVNQDFEDAGVSLTRDEDEQIVLNENFVKNIPNRTSLYESKGLIDKVGIQKSRRLKSDVFRNAVDKLDLSNVSMDTLLQLHRIGNKQSGVLAGLGLDRDINLTRRKLSRDSELLQLKVLDEIQKRYEEEAPEGINVRRHAKFLLNNGVQMIYGPKTYHTPTSFSYFAGPYYEQIENSEYSYSNARENITPMNTEITIKDIFNSLNNLMLNN